MNKEHKVLRFFMPMLACIYGISLSLLCGSVMIGEDSSLYQQLLSKLLEVLVIVLTVFLIRKIIPKAFPHVRERKLSLPPAYALIAIFLIVPLWLIVKYHLVYVTALKVKDGTVVAPDHSLTVPKRIEWWVTVFSLSIPPALGGFATSQSYIVFSCSSS